MADNTMDNTANLPATGPNTSDSVTNSQDVNPPRGNALDPTPDTTKAAPNPSGTFSTGKQPDPAADLHTVGADPVRHGNLRKTDVNLGQDTPIDAGAEGINYDSLDDDKAA